MNLVQYGLQKKILMAKIWSELSNRMQKINLVFEEIELILQFKNVVEH